MRIVGGAVLTLLLVAGCRSHADGRYYPSRSDCLAAHPGSACMQVHCVDRCEHPFEWYPNRTPGAKVP